MPLTIKVRVADSLDNIQVRVLASLRSHVDKALRAASTAIRSRIQDICVGLIQATPEYKSLLSDELLAELGIPQVNRRLREILDAVRKGVQVEVVPVTIKGNSLAGGLRISMIRSDFADLLGLPASEYISNGKYLIPWLQWLLVEGDRIIILDHEVTFALTASQRARSRTGMALMRPGAGWRVDPQFSGVLDDNFITRAFNGTAIRDLMTQVIEDEIQKRV